MTWPWFMGSSGFKEEKWVPMMVLSLLFHLGIFSTILFVPKNTVRYPFIEDRIYHVELVGYPAKVMGKGGTQARAVTKGQKTAIPKTNILAFESDEDPELATNLLVVGDKNSGSYLPDWMKFQGAKDVFNNVKSWIIGTDYVFGNLVNNLGIVYECIQDNTAAAINEPGVGVNYTDFWIVRDFEKPEFWSEKEGRLLSFGLKRFAWGDILVSVQR